MEPIQINLKRFRAGVVIATELTLCLVGWFEYLRLKGFLESGASMMDWLLTFDLETIFFICLPVLAVKFLKNTKTDSEPSSSSGKKNVLEQSSAAGFLMNRDIKIAWGISILIFFLSLLMSYLVSIRPANPEGTISIGSLPPAYHDEYSYLFQAKTFSGGKISYPVSDKAPEIFDQMHVLNKGRFASRYFPGTGLWMVPFLKMGHVYWGHWLAGAFTAFFFFWAGREMGCNGTGLLAGALVAFSPGMEVFSNLLLAHHPCMMGLSLFLFCFLRFMKTGSFPAGFFAGAGLSFAMLCRPMTAAGFALPFGLWAFYQLFFQGPKNKDADSLKRSTILFSLGIPLVIGFVILFFFNRNITGDGFKTPYQVYTDSYTPRHVYGFNNRIRGEEKLGPDVLASYDEWAENLTPRLAMENEKKRFLASLQWSLGLLPLLWGGILFLFLLPDLDIRWWLIPCSILSLHVVHVPYWFVGIMNWHYVFESGPMWLLIAAGVSLCLKQAGTVGIFRWWMGLVCLTVFLNWVSPGSPSAFESDSKIQNAVRELAFPRLKYHKFENLIHEQITSKPALVMIEHDPADRSMDYISNDPALENDILLGRYRPERRGLDEIVELFSGRSVYLYQVREESLKKISP